ncbi:GvpL/GvpF family gas vesicle protein [Pseudactinotalea sp. Z1739]|uniref:GvpL/GvpF family gas vesicle protein n=1 Tax=Pseudactinotalea sp. Z1739 TaxID=3413028 RepID=UPI003C7D94FF
MSADLYVYAISTPAEEHQLGTGIDDHPLRVITAPGGVAAVVHEHRDGPYQGDDDDDVRRWVLSHSDVVERLAEATGAVLPVSFNVIVAHSEEDPAEQRLQRWLHENADDLAARLAQLRGRIELRIEISLDAATVAQGHPETEVMRAEIDGRPAGVQRLLRKRLEHHARDLADALADELYPDYRRRLAALADDLVENRASRAEPGEVPVAAFSVLAPAERTQAIGSALAKIRDEQPAAQVRFLGPWPPYSFADVPTMTS